jgi:asparagine synthase (glutamine-hydrolysing)
MCGIVGLYSFEGPASPKVLQRGMQALQHRGPDGEGIFYSEQVAMGHTRLAILDLTTGQQPLSSEDKSIWAVVNGEFYGFKNIRAKLIQRGHSFKTKTDSEIVIHLYQEHGVEALHQLRGEFAFLLWDHNQQKLIAARDRFGVRPLCYTATPRGLMFASESKALLAMGHEAKWSQDALRQALGLQYVLPEQTIFEGIHQIPPGCFLEVQGSKWRVCSYWKMLFPTVNDPPKNLSPALSFGRRGWPRNEAGRGFEPGEVSEALHDSIKLRLRSDVPVAFQLSGGLDSSLVVAIAAKLQAEPLDCFTVRFAEDFYDESSFAKEVADFCGARLHLIEVGSKELVENIEKAIAQGEGFCMNSHVAAKYILSRSIREAGFKVVLTGEGADEVFGGYAHLQLDYSKTVQQPDAPLRDRHSHILGVHLPLGEGLSTQALSTKLGFVPSFLAAKATLGAKICSLLHPDFVEGLLQFDPAFQVSKLIEDEFFSSRHPAHQSMMLWARLGFAGYITKTLGDAMEMAHAVEARLPFVDHELFDLVRHIPPSTLFQAPKEKMLLRQIASGLLPASILERTKQPFMAPPIRRDALWETFLQDKLRGHLPDFLDKKKIFALLDKLPSMAQIERQAWDPALMMILSAVILDRAYFHTARS